MGFRDYLVESIEARERAKSLKTAITKRHDRWARENDDEDDERQKEEDRVTIKWEIVTKKILNKFEDIKETLNDYYDFIESGGVYLDKYALGDFNLGKKPADFKPEIEKYFGSKKEVNSLVYPEGEEEPYYSFFSPESPYEYLYITPKGEITVFYSPDGLEMSGEGGVEEIKVPKNLPYLSELWCNAVGHNDVLRQKCSVLDFAVEGIEKMSKEVDKKVNKYMDKYEMEVIRGKNSNRK